MATTTSSGPVSVASSSSAAAAGGSVINVSSLVSQLVAATEAPQQALIAQQTQAATASISALASLKGALSTFQSSLTALSSRSQFNAETARTSNDAVFTATAGANAVSGSYAVTVTNLASAQQLLSGPFQGGSAAQTGDGTLTISVGASSFNITVDGTNDTLGGLADAINSAADNPGISATVITGSDGGHLVLTSTLTGAANTVSVTESDGGTALAGLTYGAGNTAHYSEQSQALDADFSIAGVPYTSASNTVSNALNGVTLTLQGTTGAASGNGNSATLSVSSDTTAVETNIQNFVAAYNQLQATLSQLGSFDSTTNTAGPMLGNPVLQGVQNQINQTLHGLVGTGTYNSLASIGITTQKDGSLAVDTETLQGALSSNFSAVSTLFSSSSGVAAQLNTRINAALASGSSIDTYGKSLVAKQNSLSDQTDKLNDQMNALTASLTQQYSALNTLLSSLQTTSAYLSQAFAALPAAPGKTNS